MKHLTERQKAVLTALINHYISMAEPVSSRILAKESPLNISSATIRHTMSELEEMGYLHQPHTSAGRIPTDRAYRLYVDQLMSPEDLVESIKKQIRRNIKIANSVEDILENASRALSDISKQLGVALSPKFDEGIFNALELIRLAEHHILVVLTIRSGLVRTITIEMEVDISSEILNETARLLNERLHGLTLREIRQSIGQRLRADAHSPLLVRMIQYADQVFQMNDDRIYLGDPTQLISKPEFMDRNRLAELLCLINEKEQLAGLLSPLSSDDIQITIGTENQEESMVTYSIVSSVYRMGQNAGVLGIIGPTRMPYPRLIPIVKYTASLVDEVLSRY